MDKAKFLRMMQLNEDIKCKRKALREWQQRQDIQAVEAGRTYRVGKRMNVI